MNAGERQSAVEALANSTARIAQLERQALQTKGDNDEELRKHLDRYRSLLLAIAQIIWTYDKNGHMIQDQPSWEMYTGQTPTEYRRLGWLDAVHPDDRKLTLEAWAGASSTNTPYEVEHRLRGHDGQYRYFSVRAVPLLSPNGAVREWAGMHSDITERKRSEQNLRDGERRFRELADSMPQIVWAASADGHFDYYNKRWYDFTGRPEGITGDESWADVIHPDDQVECLARWHSATQTGDAYEIEYRLRARTGAYHWFLRRALPVRDSAGAISRWFGTCTNIDKVKETEEGLRRANAEADSSNRELEAFSYSVAHDLRAPLRSIDGFSQAVLEDSGDKLDERGRSDLARVRAGAQRMAHLIDDLLSLSRVSRSELRRENVNLTNLAVAIGERLREAEKDRDVEIRVQDGLMVDGDQSLISALLENLLANAWKFTSRRSKARIEVGFDSSSGKPAYFVRDNGAGFDMAYASKLFGAFQRLHASAEFPGSGIGLATAQRIVRRHGGEIWAQGQIDQGATFYFSL
jgi:PAS domain S-box-containing protein